MENRKTFGLGCAAVAALYFLSFLSFYIPNYAVEIDSVAVLYIIEFFGRLCKFLAPCLAAAVLLFSDRCELKSLLLRAAALGATSAAYNFLYYYLYFLAFGNDSIEGSLLSLGASLLGALLAMGYALFGFLIGREVIISFLVSERLSELPPLKAREKATKQRLRAEVKGDACGLSADVGAFDLGAPVAAATFSVCFLQFCIMTVSEAVSIVSYLIEYAGNYRSGEIIYIVVSLLFIFAELFLGQLICVAAGKFMKARSVGYESEN